MEYLVMCIGNRDGGDDAVGPYIADVLKQKKLDDIEIIDAGTVPENYTGKIKDYKPEKLVLIDSVDMNLKPGEIRKVPKEKIGVMHISTHGIPLSVLMNYLEKYVKNIVLIGIQPKNMAGEITDIVRESGDRLSDLLKENKIGKIARIT